MQRFVDEVYLPDTLAIAGFYKDWFEKGEGVGIEVAEHIPELRRQDQDQPGNPEPTAANQQEGEEQEERHVEKPEGQMRGQLKGRQQPPELAGGPVGNLHVVEPRTAVDAVGPFRAGRAGRGGR